MTDNTPDSFDTLKARLVSLEKRAHFEDARKELQDIAEKVEQKLPQTLKDLRERGYQYRAHLDEASSKLVSQWHGLRNDLESHVKRESENLRQQVHGLADVLQKVTGNETGETTGDDGGRRLKLSRETRPEDKAQSSRLAGKFRDSRAEDDESQASSRRLKLSRESDDSNPEGDDVWTKIQGQLESLEERIRSFETTVQEKISEVSGKEYEITREAGLIEWYLQQFEDADFPRQPGEALVMAAKAEWIHSSSDKDNPDGILYLTNHRLIFEQKEKVGKRFGIFGGQKVQDVVWEFPVKAITRLEHENKGMFGGKDMVHIHVSEGAPLPQITVEVKGGADNKHWVSEIQKVMSGDIEQERIR